ncbi:GIN domain-containing protein [Flaviaesturariibacter amylovorans]|uniref:Putative auto-transporter adhesin head GIN domain-containing protein n=1 Tax=Flaviaesturariibacter amylovorans TaxID=1084520 RepID=A0ABP8GDD1_9BACT
MKTPLFLLSGLLFLASCTKEGIRGEGAIVTDTRTVSDFYIVRMEGDAQVEITEGSPRKVEVSGYENLVPRYETSSANGQLTLRFESDVNTVRRNNIKVRITAPYVTQVALNGSGAYDLSNMSSNEMMLDVKGSGRITAHNCQWGKTTAVVEGSGTIDARENGSAAGEATIYGSGLVRIYADWRLAARVNGSGTIEYYGAPTQTDFSVSGSGRINPR